jgi:hypothetical protein
MLQLWSRIRDDFDTERPGQAGRRCKFDQLEESFARDLFEQRIPRDGDSVAEQDGFKPAVPSA